MILKKTFKDLDFGYEEKYPINEFFCSIQGEAFYTGTPSFFIRFQGCPVGCNFCDTKYTWDLNKSYETKNIDLIESKKNIPNIENFGTKLFKYFEIFELRSICIKNKPNHIVFTGGEPCIYNLRAITKELNDFRPSNRFYRFSTQIETSGTFEINCDPNTWVTLSPKINKKYKVLESSYKRANEIKYPIGKQKDINDLMEILEKHKIANDIKIWLQPLSQNKKATQLCIENAIKYNFKLSLQTHKYLNIR